MEEQAVSYVACSPSFLRRRRVGDNYRKNRSSRPHRRPVVSPAVAPMKLNNDRDSNTSCRPQSLAKEGKVECFLTPAKFDTKLTIPSSGLCMLFRRQTNRGLHRSRISAH